jgi:hypothetical protein
MPTNRINSIDQTHSRNRNSCCPNTTSAAVSSISDTPSDARFKVPSLWTPALEMAGKASVSVKLPIMPSVIFLHGRKAA